VVAAFSAALFAAALVMESAGILYGFGIEARFAYGIPAAMLVAGLATAEEAHKLQIPRWLRSLGQASYSIYLFQFVFIGLVWQGFLTSGLDRAPPHFVLFGVLVISALSGGIAMSRWVEQPLLRLTRHGSRAPRRHRAG
jgi:peptidoglycan/LPS O-acetylase OafA/YrhL